MNTVYTDILYPYEKKKSEFCRYNWTSSGQLSSPAAAKLSNQDGPMLRQGPAGPWVSWVSPTAGRPWVQAVAGVAGAPT